MHHNLKPIKTRNIMKTNVKRESVRVETYDQLISLIKSGVTEYFMSGGIFRTSYDISLNGDVLSVYSYVNDCGYTLTKEEFFDHSVTNLGRAMEDGALFAEVVTIEKI